MTMAGASGDWTPESGCIEPCPLHSNHVIKFYCPNHYAFACGNCLIENHVRCDCDYIPDIATNYESSEESRNFNKAVVNLGRRVKEMTIDWSWKALLDIQDCRTEIDAALDKYQADLVNETQAIQTQSRTDTDSSQYDIDSKQDDVPRRTQSLLHESKDDDDRDSIQPIEAMAPSSIAQSPPTGKGIPNVQYTFKRDCVLNDLLQSGCNVLGTLVSIGEDANKDKPIATNKLRHTFETVDKATQTSEVREAAKETLQCEGATAKSPQASCNPGDTESFVFHPDRYECVLRAGSLSSLPSINAKISTHKMMNNNSITGIACVAFNKVIVADGDQHSLVIVDAKGRIIVQFKRLKSKPFDVASLPNHQVAVTFPFEKAIKIFLIYYPFNRIHIFNTIRVQGECYGISYKSDKLVVSMMNPIKIEIMDLTGKVYNSFNPAANGRNILQWPYYVTLTDDVSNLNDESTDAIFVSDKYKKAVFKLSMDGELLSTYKHFVQEENWTLVPNGICAAGGGNIVVCSNYMNENRIVLVSPDGIIREHLLKEDNYICHPCAVCYNPIDLRLYVTYMTDQALGNEKCNTISVYEVFRTESPRSSNKLMKKKGKQ